MIPAAPGRYIPRPPPQTCTPPSPCPSTPPSPTIPTGTPSPTQTNHRANRSATTRPAHFGPSTSHFETWTDSSSFATSPFGPPGSPFGAPQAQQSLHFRKTSPFALEPPPSPFAGSSTNSDPAAPASPFALPLRHSSTPNIHSLSPHARVGAIPFSAPPSLSARRHLNLNLNLAAVGAPAGMMSAPLERAAPERAQTMSISPRMLGYPEGTPEASYFPMPSPSGPGLRPRGMPRGQEAGAPPGAWLAKQHSGQAAQAAQAAQEQAWTAAAAAAAAAAAGYQDMGQVDMDTAEAQAQAQAAAAAAAAEHWAAAPAAAPFPPSASWGAPQDYLTMFPDPRTSLPFRSTLPTSQPHPASAPPPTRTLTPPGARRPRARARSRAASPSWTSATTAPAQQGAFFPYPAPAPPTRARSPSVTLHELQSQYLQLLPHLPPDYPPAHEAPAPYPDAALWAAAARSSNPSRPPASEYSGLAARDMGV
jgi:hypothetical protein